MCVRYALRQHGAQRIPGVQAGTTCLQKRVVGEVRVDSIVSDSECGLSTYVGKNVHF